MLHVTGKAWVEGVSWMEGEGGGKGGRGKTFLILYNYVNPITTTPALAISHMLDVFPRLYTF